MIKSKISNKRPVDWDAKILVDDIVVSPQLIESHRQKINVIFKDKPEEFKNEQINKVILHDVLFSHAMDRISQFYDIEFDNDEINAVKENTKRNFPSLDDVALDNLAQKTIIKQLIFTDLQNEYQINVDDEELKKILMSYYQDTNQPIRDFMKNDQSYQLAKQSILNEKTITFIIKKINFDLSGLTEKIKKFIETSKTTNK